MTPSPADVPSHGSAPNFEPVERFVRDVLPRVSGGRQRVTNRPGHLDLIQRAATDRGLSIKTIGRTVYFYDGRLPVGGMAGWTPTLVGREAHAVCASKARTKQMLDAAGVPTPSGIVVGPDQFETALAYVTATGRPSVLKPSSGKGGAGVTCGIDGEDALRAAWDAAKDAAGAGASFVLEEQIDGIDVRVFVVGRRVVAAVTRLHAHVVGDGQRSITELIQQKQRWRDEHVLLAKNVLTADTALLERGGWTIKDVPAVDEIVVLNRVANLHAGGENVDVTELAHPDLLKLAVDATRAIPGLGIAGVDMMAPDLGTVDGAVVLETNVGANIRMHHFPAYGEPRDVAGDIIDEMIATAGAPARSPSRRRARNVSVARRLARAARRRVSADPHDMP